MNSKLPVVVILGATGAGKSQLALELAQKFGGEIVSADAVQMYKGLDIITNKVTAEEQKLVKHHMIDVLDSLAVNSVVDYRNKALPIIERLLRENKIPFICGGTNYYIESLLWKILIDEETPFLTSKRKLEQHEDPPPKKKCSSDESKDLDQLNAKDAVSSIDFEEDDESISTNQLYAYLKEIDPVRTERLHPKERRKIWRSLQVWQQHGARHSDLIQSQGGVLGGGLRFPEENICIIEVWSDQKTLDERCDRRVDKMVTRGMVQELEEFHAKFNRERLKSGKGKDYTTGIFQSIGFKEFHDYLGLDAEARETEEGRKEFEKGINLLKTATRQYARRQAKWMKKRFLLEDRKAPPVYRVDSSDPSLWQERCYKPALEVLQAFTEGRKPATEPLAKFSLDRGEFEDNRITYHCDACHRDFKGNRQYLQHLSGKSHRQVIKRKLAEQPPIRLIVKQFDEEKRAESVKILKNTFEQPLKDVLKVLDNLPCEIAKIKPKSKAENLKKCLAKHGIVIDFDE